MTLDEWRAYAAAEFGNLLDAPFRCPVCGHVATPRDWRAMGMGTDRAPTECIGRAYLDSPLVKNEGIGCHYAAFGFIQVAELVPVALPDGATVLVFPFAKREEKV